VRTVHIHSHPTGSHPQHTRGTSQEPWEAFVGIECEVKL